MVGGFAWRGRYIGTIRVVPLGQGLAPCEKILRQHSLLTPELSNSSWEVGRLVLAEEYRSSSPEVLKRCMTLTLINHIQRWEGKNFFAACSPILARLYRRFGFSVLVKDAGQGDDGTFSLIHATAESLTRALADEPQELPQDHPAPILARDRTVAELEPA